MAGKPNFSPLLEPCPIGSEAPETLLLKLADGLGIRYDQSPLDEGETHKHWDGMAQVGRWNHQCADIAHEIAHWLVAHPSRRSLDNFGLGMSYICDDPNPKHGKLSDRHADKEESWVALLGCWLERLAGRDPGFSMDMMSLIPEPGKQNQSLSRIWATLTRRGLIRPSLEAYTLEIDRV